MKKDCCFSSTGRVYEIITAIPDIVEVAKEYIKWCTKREFNGTSTRHTDYFCAQFRDAVDKFEKALKQKGKCGRHEKD